MRFMIGRKTIVLLKAIGYYLVFLQPGRSKTPPAASFFDLENDRIRVTAS
jgi:hypothetical protein